MSEGRAAPARVEKNLPGELRQIMGPAITANYRLVLRAADSFLDQCLQPLEHGFLQVMQLAEPRLYLRVTPFDMQVAELVRQGMELGI